MKSKGWSKMATVNGVPFRQNLVSSSKYGIKAPNTMKPKKITVHNTYNDATSQNETDYCKNNNNEVSFHVAVDDKEAIQVVPFNRNAWHCGDGGNGYGNRNTIGVEICYSKSGGSKYTKSEQNAIKYIAGLCVQQGIAASKDTIKKHQDWSGKYCPHRILAEKRWSAMQQAIIDEYNRIKSSKPHTPASSNKNTYYTENPKKIKTLVKCDLYDSVDFIEKHKTGGTYPKGTVFTISGMAKTKGGTPRLKTKSGYYITANKKFVKKI